MMEYDEREALCDELVDEILELLNKKVIGAHRAGKLEPSEAIFVASAAAARVAAITLCDQLPNKEDAPRIMDSFIQLFKGDCQSVLASNSRKERRKDESKSVWGDLLRKVIKH